MRNSTRTRRWDGAAIQGLTVVIIVALALLTLAALAPSQDLDEGHRNGSSARHAPHGAEVTAMHAPHAPADIPR